MPAKQPIWQESVRNGRNVDPIHSQSHHMDKLKKQNTCNTSHSHSPIFLMLLIFHMHLIHAFLILHLQLVFCVIPSLFPCSWYECLWLQGHVHCPHVQVFQPIPCQWSCLPLIPSCWQLLQCPLIIISNNIKTKTPETSPIQKASTVLSWCVGEKGTLKYCIKVVFKPLPRAKVKVHAQRSELAAKVCYSEYFFF